jgi:hypothetical protein
MADGSKRVFTSAPPYKFNYGQPGHFIEIYLPKKAVYQGALYDALTEGFDHKKVKQHFIDNHTYVASFLESNEELFGAFKGERYKGMNPCYFGYSLYELDGVFFDPKDPDCKPCEERVQVIRIMFLPPAEIVEGAEEGVKKEKNLAAKRYIRFWTQDLHEYKEDLKHFGRDIEKQGIAERLRDWLKDVGLFLHGFILFRLCKAIEEKVTEKAIDKLEDVIWMTSFRCLAVVKTSKRQADAAPKVGETPKGAAEGDGNEDHGASSCC